MENKLTKLEKLTKQIEALQAKANSEKNREREKSRKEETRKKILIGAMVLDGMSKNQDYQSKMLKNLDKYLTAERDRKLFNLTPINKNYEE
jgi:large subunit ribosomal protein L7/L12